MAPSASGIHGQLLEVTVVGCKNLLDTEWISKQDPYVCVEYANTKFRTRTCTDGHTDPTFQEKFVISLIEGLHELNVLVWNSNTITYDALIGSGRIQLHKVLTQGFDDTQWPLESKYGRHAGDVRLIMHYANASGKPAKGATLAAPNVQPYTVPASPHVPQAPPVAPHVAPYAMPPAAPPFAPPATYPAASPYPSYPTHPTPYPAPPAAYNPHQYPHQASYPPPPHAVSHYPAGTYPGAYPPAY